MKKFLFLLLLASCSNDSSENDVRKMSLPAPVNLDHHRERYEQFSANLLTSHLANGYVVNIKDGVQNPEGDSLLFSSLAMAALPCSDALKIFDAIDASATSRDGALIRIEPPLPQHIANRNMTSRDMEAGAIFGLTDLWHRCGLERAKPLWLKHRQFVHEQGGGFLHPDAYRSLISPGIAFSMDGLSFALSQAPRPKERQLVAFEGSAIFGAIAIAEQKDSCYPIHLSTIAIIASAWNGLPISQDAQAAFCEATAGMDLPLTDWLCERLDLDKWLGDFQPGAWEYRHQRCPAWESQDGHPNEQAPNIDWLILYKVGGGKL